jgi:murein endopeptidase
MRALAATLVLAAALATPAQALTPCDSRPAGKPWHGHLLCGVQLPVASADFTTWDNALQELPNRPWRRWGTAKLVLTAETIAAEYHARYGDRLLIGDLSRPSGGPFGRRYGGEGHASHQSGLDVDIYYPRRDRAELPPFAVGDIDRRRAQWLVDRVALDAKLAFIGPNTKLRRPSRNVQYLAGHDNHVHVRIPWP